MKLKEAWVLVSKVDPQIALKVTSFDATDCYLVFGNRTSAEEACAYFLRNENVLLIPQILEVET